MLTPLLVVAWDVSAALLLLLSLFLYPAVVLRNLSANRVLHDCLQRTAVLLKNTSGLTLEGGPMTVLEDEAYRTPLFVLLDR